MTPPTGRYNAALPARAAMGWTLDRLTQPSRLYGANGISTGKDGRIYVAQVAGSQVSALDPDSGEITTISARNSAICSEFSRTRTRLKRKSASRCCCSKSSLTSGEPIHCVSAVPKIA